MPESKGRGNPRPRESARGSDRKAEPGPSPRWLVPLMLTLFGLGLLWIVAYYLIPDVPPFSSLGVWNMVIGFGLILCGFGLSTRWR
jgi:Cell division protein CrgA